MFIAEHNAHVRVVYVCIGLFVALISEGHVYVVERGSTVSLECNFHADQYDLFEYPVLWRKRQHLEDSQVNVMGTLMEPFSQLHRFEVTFDAFDSRYRLMLHIHGRLSPSLSSIGYTKFVHQKLHFFVRFCIRT